MKIKKVFLHVVLALVLASVFHEGAHAVVGMLFGWRVDHFVFMPFLRYVVLYPASNPPPFWQSICVYGAGGFINVIIYAYLLNEMRYNPSMFWDRDKTLIYGGLIFSVLYGFFETIVFGIFGWFLL